MGAEAAIVRNQFVSGTHAIATALFAVLRPGDELLAVAGRCRFCRLSVSTLTQTHILRLLKQVSGKPRPLKGTLVKRF